MKVKSIALTNFRNYSFSETSFDDGLNIVVGKNAQGKTNLLEAIYFCAIGKSLRAVREKELINWDKPVAKISLEVEKKFGKTRIDITLNRVGKKIVAINRLPIRKIGELMGELNAVFFSPDELKLVKESPEDRRRFMDISISQTSKQYFYLLGRYSKVLANRNKLLKQALSPETIKDTIGLWDEQLSSIGAKLIMYRVAFLKNILPFARLSHEYLTEGTEELNLEYAGTTGEDEAEIKTKLLKQLENSLEKDMRLQFTSVGPHRDDIKVWVNGIDIKTYGSQGQQRTVALSLKLAELEIIERQTGEKPILILDDVLSELDEKRKKRLLAFCKKTQTFLSCTDFNYDVPHKTIVVDRGSIV